MTNLPLKELHRRLHTGELTFAELCQSALVAAETFSATNMFLWRDGDAALGRAADLDQEPPSGLPLAGLPVSVKDLFDLAGAPTTCGSPFFKSTRPLPIVDAGYVARWRRAGVNFIGKTNLNEFAYGITGENRWFGDCTVPGFPERLTGGSSSGAAASVAAGAACLALGTDTGGSLRVPASLCGLVSVRQSLGFAEWSGAFPLAHSFDTAGWLQRHLSDVAFVGHALHPELAPASLASVPRVAVLAGTWLDDVDADVLKALKEMSAALKQAGGNVQEVNAAGWEQTPAIFVPIQAHEAARIHGPFLPDFSTQYDPAVLGRLKMGLQVSEHRYEELKGKQTEFVMEKVMPLFERADFLVAPACATNGLETGADHAAVRPRLLKLTTPASLAGLPAVTIPWRVEGWSGIGFQVLAARSNDALLWAFAEWLANREFNTK